MDQAFQSRVDAFLANKRIAVVGYSRKGDVPANGIYEKFADNGYEVTAINPHAEEITEVPCAPDLYSLEKPAEAVLIAGPRSATMEVLKACADLGIKHVWIHRSIDGGSYVPEADEFAAQHGIELISFGCPMMFIRPDVFHRCFKWIFNLQGKFRVPEPAV